MANEPKGKASRSKAEDHWLRPKLEKARLELLDLSTRNRLLHTPKGSRTKSVEIVGESSAQVFERLVSRGRAFTFAAGRNPDREDTLDDGGQEELTQLAQPEDTDELDGEAVSRRRSDSQLQTRLTSEGLQKRLLSLYLDARTLREEQGVNILYLAIGMLKWFEDANSEVERYAPLILVPVSLERGTAGEKFKLRWSSEDPSDNLSLGAFLKRQFGIELPQLSFNDETFDATKYLDEVSSAISAQRRWTVLEDDIVLGFFSFAKFLMYRDLDGDTWPKEASLFEHRLVSGLMGDGFPASETLIGDDEPIDPHIPVESLTHIVDADSSQTVAIHEARHQRDMVIQGPPGTGKSQTIANIIASAVLDGKSVLFVAEKMAALEVVKRRLDNAGVGDICLELHSNKANKRTVLEELHRTWELGRPNGNADSSIIKQLSQTRQTLNEQASRLHQSHAPSGMTPYQVIGQLVRLRQNGQRPNQANVIGSEKWSRSDREQRERQLDELAEWIEDIGVPTCHVWRGVQLPSILPTDVDRLVARIEKIQARFKSFANSLAELGELLGEASPATFPDTIAFTSMAIRVAAAPDLESIPITATCWLKQSSDIAELIKAGSEHHRIQQELKDVVAETAWETDVKSTRQQFASHGDSWFRWLDGKYRSSNRLFQSILTGPPPKRSHERLLILDKIAAAQKAREILVLNDAVGRDAFGPLWKSAKSDWGRLKEISDWNAGNGSVVLATKIRRLSADPRDKSKIGSVAQVLSKSQPELERDLRALFVDLKLDVLKAFSKSELSEIELRKFGERLDEWIANPESLSKWVAYNGRANRARNMGLSEFVDQLESGKLTSANVLPEYEMAYYSSLLALIAKDDPAIAEFDGKAQDSTVDRFRKYDEARIKLAQLEVAAAHFQKVPRADAGAGPVGTLRGEIARKRGHMPIRQLMKRAGPVIQAIKPVFMMSPLSVAQFLEPGAIYFDLLVIDEASQVQPVDALGAIARCKQAIVVGDDRQLPPTRFFSKIIADDDRDEDDEVEAQIGDVESILGLCVSKGLPQRMLRWHYRSKHQSLIAVSNSQFYDNRLFIVPSPYTSEAGIGLQFHHIPNATFDSGNTATNKEEARAVANAIIEHARNHPDLSLGVATFSARQRVAILDEVEQLRRRNSEVESFFASHLDEPFFIKNLENVQGDERDVIFISVGYGRNAQGYMAMRFGPLSNEGGERRLNVLISRAKRRCEVFSSITDDDIDLERGRGIGVSAFKLFLNFARTGKLAIAQKTNREFDSIFEEQVATALKQRGYDVHAQVGLAGFFIDLAIADYDMPGRFVLGIECDGAAYHSSRSARDRDRLRQSVLEDHGWIIHRIWSTDWFNRPSEQLERTVAAIEAARIKLNSITDNSRPIRTNPFESSVRRTSSSEVSDESSLSVPYKEARIAVPSKLELHEVPTGTLVKLIEQIIDIEGPIHRSEIVARLRSLWGLQRAGNRIQAAVDEGLKSAVRAKNIVKTGEFFEAKHGEVAIRDRSNVESAGLRKPENLPPTELGQAIVTFVDSNLGATADEIVLAVARLLGFKATSGQLRERIEEVIKQTIRQGRLTRHGDLLKTNSPTS